MSPRTGRYLCERRDTAVVTKRTNVHAGLVARSRELAHIDQLLWQARRGRSGVIALRGEAGVGKSALVEAAVARATEFRTVQVRGRSGADATLPTQWPDPLHELADVVGAAAPVLRRPPGILQAPAKGPARSGARRATPPGAATTPPGPAAPAAPVDDHPVDDPGDDPHAQEPEALPSAAASGAPDVAPDAVEAAARSVRRLLAGTSESLLVTMDDCQSLPPGAVTAMVAAVLTELADLPISLVLAWRDTPHLEPFELGTARVPVHRLAGLNLPQARELLSSRFDQLPPEPILAELVGRTGGNPLALVELSNRLSAAELAGWHPLPDPLPIGGALAEAFDVVRYLPPATRRALAVVAAGGASRDVLLAAMQRVGVTSGDLLPAFDAGVIVERGPRIDFRHPLVRSVAFHRAPTEVRHAVRSALSDVLADAHAIEASAYHAAVDVVTPDELAARRLAQAARIALDRGDPAAAARHEELAARCSGAVDAVGQHLADAAGHWLAAGARDRARYCAESAAELELSPPVGAELAYQRARLVQPGAGGDVAARMVSAASRCERDRPHRALAMLVDAAAWQILANEPVAAEATAERAVRLAGLVSSHSEVLARSVRAAAAIVAGGDTDDIAERGHVSLLIGQTERFPSSPEVAFVIGRSLWRQGLRRQAERWAQWIERCAERSGDISLSVVAPLLEGTLAMHDGRLADAAEAITAGAVAADEAGSVAMAAWGWQLATELHALCGHYEAGFRDAARLFAATDRLAGTARLRALPSLALLELMRGRRLAAVAWARTVEHEMTPWRRPGALPTALAAEVAPLVASVLLLARDGVDPAPWESLLELSGPRRPAEAPLAPRAGTGDDPPAEGGTAAAGESRQRAAAWLGWLRGVTAPAGPAGLADLASASAAYRDRPLLQALIDICCAVRLAETGLVPEAVTRLETIERAMRSAGAHGLAAVAANERAALPMTERHDGTEGPAAARRGGRDTAADTGHEWEITMLGGFAIRHRGKPVPLPASLATQAVKIAAVRSRLTIDELIELLWEDAEPGVGARRLRNVLWRIRSACGDLLVRQGSFLQLAADASTDVERFRTLAERALVAADDGTGQAVELAREALALYRGELLPGDRYADWAAAAREGAARTYLRLLDLLVDDALAADRTAEALVLLDRLAEVDPYDERHHLRAAEIHRRAGNRVRALEALDRAERLLADLGVGSSPAVRQLRDALGAG